MLAQSFYIANDKAYIVVNNSNKVEVVNANTFESNFMIDAALPRYFTIFNGKGYLTEWVSYTESGRVSVINLSNGLSETTITTGFGAENIIEINGKLYVSNNFRTNVSVLDPNSNEVVQNITVGNAPGEFVLDKNEFLWVICGGGFDANFSPLNNGVFCKINTADNTVSAIIELGINVPVKIAMNSTKGVIYYFKGNKVYKLGINDTSKPSSAFITENAAIGFYGIGVNPTTGNIYMGNAKGFQGNGVVFRYSSDGVPIDNFNVGIGPNGFAFK